MLKWQKLYYCQDSHVAIKDEPPGSFANHSIPPIVHETCSKQFYLNGKPSLQVSDKYIS